MADAEPTESLQDGSWKHAGAHATEAFALLGNETRLAVLMALWEEYDPHADENAVPFSRIFERVDYDDPGNLSYHLGKLEGQFVRQRAERGGYELRETGLKLVRAVIAGAGVADVTLEATRIDQPCPFCDATTAVSYREGVVVHACTTCEGAAPGRTETDGFLSAVPFDPAGLAGRSPQEVRAASTVAAVRQVQSLFDGLCPACSGPVDSWLEHCADHDPTGDCERCGMKSATLARFQCQVCKNHSASAPESLALFHPAVISFYDDRGVSTRIRADDFESVRRVFDLVDGHGMELVSEDPPRVAVTATLDGDGVRLTFDEAASVVDVRR